MTLVDGHYLDDLRSLRDGQELMRAAFHAARDAMAITDDSGSWLEVNGAMAALLGARPQQLLGRRLREFLAPGQALALEPSLDAPDERRVDLLRPDDTTRTVELLETAEIRAGRHLITLRDVTGERSINAERAQLAAVLETAPDAVIGFTLDGRITSWNAAATSMYGLMPDDAVGAHLSRLLTPERQPQLAELLTGLAAGRSIPRRDTVHCRADGRPFDVSTSTAPTRDRRGRITGGSLIVREAGGGDQLDRRRRQAERLESLGRLAGGVAHAFNNLLTAIMGYADLLLADLPANDDSSRRDAIEIRRAADRAARLTAQLLAFSRRQPVEPVLVDVPSGVDEIAPLLRRLIGADIDLRVAHHAASAWIRIDPGQLDQVVLNLVLNGRDAMRRGGLLTIETDEVDLDAAHAALHPGATPGRHVRLAVSDTGVGMDPATLERVFEPFFTTRDGGTGLGLATVYGIVTGAGGHVWAYSEVGRGSEFKVYLPVAAAPAPAAVAEAPALAIGSETVLLLEDDAAVRVLARSVLERAGYRVLAAADPGEALALALDRQARIDLLITDLILPGMSGPQLARQLATIGSVERVLYISGYSETASRERGLIEADDAFLPKPFTADGLTRRVRALLDSPA